jgi:ankyrin repeat protein
VKSRAWILVFVCLGCAEVPARPTVPLVEAVAAGNVAQVKANIEWCHRSGSCNLDARNEHGETVLFNAIAAKRTELVKLLLDAGASANVADNAGSTPIFVAVLTGNLDVVKALIAAGAITSVSYQSITLEQASSSYPEIVAYLHSVSR